MLGYSSVDKEAYIGIGAVIQDVVLGIVEVKGVAGRVVRGPEVWILRGFLIAITQ